MKQWIWAVAIAATTVGFGARAQSIPGSDIESLLAIARESNPQAATAWREADASKERVGPAGALPDPHFKTEWMDLTKQGMQTPALLPSSSGSASHTLSQTLPWFGKRDIQRSIAESEADGAFERAEAQWNEIAAKIKKSFIQMFYLGQSEILSKESLDLTSRIEQVAQARYAGGLAAQQDVLRAQMEATTLRGDLITVESELKQERSRLNALIGRRADAELARPIKLPYLPSAERLGFESIEPRALRNNPLIRVEEAQLSASEKRRSLVYKNRYPDFTVGLSSIQTQSSFNQWNVMVELNIPLQSTRRAQERESQALVEAASARRDALANQISSELSENISALLAAKKTDGLTSGTLLPQAELAFQSALSGYENGKVDFSTLLDAQRQIRQARQSQIKSQAESRTRLANIEQLLGESL